MYINKTATPTNGNLNVSHLNILLDSSCPSFQDGAYDQYSGQNKQITAIILGKSRTYEIIDYHCLLKI